MMIARNGKTNSLRTLPALTGYIVCLLFTTFINSAADSLFAQPPDSLSPEMPEVKTVDVTFEHNGASVSSKAEVRVEYADGSMLLLTPDGQLWTLHAEEIQSVERSESPMQPMTSEEIFDQFRQQLPPGFEVYKTRHYVLIYNTSNVYVRWVGELFERLYRGFYNFWRSRRVKLEEPRFPLVAVVFSNKASYMQYAEREIGESAKAMIGYYNMKTNRMTTFDMTGVDGLVPPGRQISSAVVINQILSQPQAERTVATIVHEAVHQLSFNSGLQTRLADNPLWLSEGLAMFFETPDVSNGRGWGNIGKVNYHNFKLFAQYVPRRPQDSLMSLLTNDDRLRKSESASHAYAESWALTYFLIKTKTQEYADYLQELSDLPPLGETSPRERVRLFQEHFGTDLNRLDREFISFMRRIR